MIRVGYRGYGDEGTLNEDSMFKKNIEGANGRRNQKQEFTFFLTS